MWEAIAVCPSLSAQLTGDCDMLTGYLEMPKEELQAGLERPFEQRTYGSECFPFLSFVTENCNFANAILLLWNDPEFYPVSEADSRVFGTGHLDLTVVKDIPSVRLVFDQFVRFDNLNPPRAH